MGRRQTALRAELEILKATKVRYLRRIMDRHSGISCEEDNGDVSTKALGGHFPVCTCLSLCR